jgi:bifunctional DNase/RNase
LTELRDGVFYAELLLTDKSGQRLTVSARPSDAIALALRVKCGIFSTVELLNESGIEIPVDDGIQANEEVERFREFLDQITPEDFAG